MQQAVGPLAVGKRGLEGEGAFRQPVLDDGLHAHLAEGAARLLVGEDLLKGDHVAGEVGEVLLRRVDHGEPLMQLGDGVGGLARRLGQVRADPMGHAVEPLVDGAGELAVTADADLGKRLEPHFQLGELGVALLRLAPPPAHMHRDDDDQHQQGKRREPEQSKQDQHGVERDAPHLDRL